MTRKGVAIIAIALGILSVGVIAVAQNLRVTGTTTGEGDVYVYGRLGLGTTLPDAKLHIADAEPYYAAIFDSAAGTSMRARITTTGAFALVPNDGGGDRWDTALRFDHTTGSWSVHGGLGIGTTAPTEALDVEGAVRAADGVRFGDGTVQTTAAEPLGPTGPMSWTCTDVSAARTGAGWNDVRAECPAESKVISGHCDMGSWWASKCIEQQMGKAGNTWQCKNYCTRSVTTRATAHCCH